MTSKERLGALLSGSLPDRVPVLCNLLEQGASELGLSIKDYYSNGENVALGQIRLQEKYGYDQLWGFHYSAGEAEILGAKHTVFAPDGPPNMGQLLIREPGDIDRLSVEDSVFESPYFMELLKTIYILKEEKGDEFPILTSVLGSVSLPPILMGMEYWLDLLYSGEKEKARLLLEKCSRFCHRKMELLLDAGVDSISYFNPLGSTYFVNAAQFDRDVLSWVQQDIESLPQEKLIYFNGGGCINPVIPSLLSNTSFRAFYINPFDDVAKAKALLAGRGLLMAPINDIPLIHQTDDEIRGEVRRIMEEGASSGGFCFGTLVMPLEVKDHSIRVMIEAAREYGRYE